MKNACEGLIGFVSAELTQPLLPFLSSHAAAAAGDGGTDAPGGAAPGGPATSLPSAQECADVLAETVR